MKKTGAARIIREYMIMRKAATIDDIQAETSMERMRLRYALADFLKRGELIKTDGKYIYNCQNTKFAKVDKVYKAMRYLGRFTIDELSQLTSTNTRYISDIIKRYKKEGLIQRIGTINKKKIIYCIDKNIRERPTLKRWTKIKNIKERMQ